MKTKIEWCDWVWNPAWGCLNACPFCYARKIAKRFYKRMALKEYNYPSNKLIILDLLERDLYNFKPTWLESNFQKSFPKKPSRIFVDSMSDIAFWKPEWMRKVLNKIKEYLQHTFIFLTKNPEVYDKYNFSKNCWLGVTITNQKQMIGFTYAECKTSWYRDNIYFMSFEPLQENINISIYPDWIIIGAETGNRKNKIIPNKRWIELMLIYSRLNNIPLFMKNNLQKVWKETLIQEWPE